MGVTLLRRQRRGVALVEETIGRIDALASDLERGMMEIDDDLCAVGDAEKAEQQRHAAAMRALHERGMALSGAYTHAERVRERIKGLLA